MSRLFASAGSAGGDGDAAAAEASDVAPCEGCFVYAVPDYGVPEDDAGPEFISVYGVP